MIFYYKTQTSTFGINLNNVINFLYDNKEKKLTVNYIDGKSYVTTEIDYIKSFLNAITELEKLEKAIGATAG